jgi:integration host factor subunit alpha
MALTKNDIVDSIYTQLGIPKKRSVELVESLLEIIKGTLEKGEDVLISGFGKFCVKNKNERMGRDIQTGDDMILKPRRVVTFRCSGVLRDKINGNA